MMLLVLALGVSQRNCAMAPLGCANAANLAVQLANPDDLVSPASLPSAQGTAPIAGVDRYVRGTPTPLPQGDSSAGAAPK